MTTTAPLRVGVIGTGVWGCHALEHYLVESPGVEIAAVTSSERWGASQHSDPPEIAGRRHATDLGAEFRDDWRDITGDPTIDIISLMTAPAFRREPAIVALRSGKHVICDKPLAKTLEDAVAIADAESRSSGVGFMLCGMHTRPAVARLIAAVREGRIGTPHHARVELWFSGGIFPGFTPTRKWLDGTVGGEMTNIGSHAIRTLMVVAGDRPVAVSARTESRFYPEYQAVGAEDCAQLEVEFAGGLLGSTLCGRLPYNSRGERFAVDVVGERFAVDVVGDRGAVTVRGGECRFEPDGEIFTDMISSVDAVRDDIARFLAAVRGEGSPVTTFGDGLIVNHVLDAAYHSASECRLVSIADI
jgi:predicted dehydrogenase